LTGKGGYLAAFPSAAGEPELIVRAAENWHVHNGGWSYRPRLRRLRELALQRVS
jgi:hypothetical protein